MVKTAAIKILEFAKPAIIDNISKLYAQHHEEVAQIAEETKSDEAKFSFIVELKMNDPSSSLVRMSFIKKYSYWKRTVIKNPNQLDLLAAKTT